MLQNLESVDDFVNNLQEKAMQDNGHRKKMPVEDALDDYRGHYDFEPARKHSERAHPLHNNHEEEDNAPGKVIQEEEVTICFVKAYARKPLGPPTRNVVPFNPKHQNGLPNWHEYENYFERFGSRNGYFNSDSEDDYSNSDWYSDSESYYTNESSYLSNSSLSSSEFEENEVDMHFYDMQDFNSPYRTRGHQSHPHRAH